MKIYITRHSKTVWNEEKRLQGRLDSPLTQDGVENALALKNYLQEHSFQFDYVYSSPIPRAYQTACLLFDKQNITMDERLMEMNFGDFEGQKIVDLLTYHHKLYDQLWNHPEQFDRIPHGESYQEVIERVKSFLQDLKQLPQDSQVMIVTHGMCFVIFMSVFLGLTQKELASINQQIVEGCSLTCVEENHGSYQILSYNEHQFLPHVMNASFAK